MDYCPRPLHISTRSSQSLFQTSRSLPNPRILIFLSTARTVFFTGVGKSTFVANKVSQMLVSLSFPSSFLTPLDALHGDFDATEERLHLVSCARAKGAFLVSLTSFSGNPLAGVCDMNVHLPLQRELCLFNLAPVTSTVIQMVFGDAIVVALMAARNLSKEEYEANHPAGKIGKSLSFKVKDVMKKQEELHVCKEGDLIMDQLVELTSKGCGCLLVVDEQYHLIGVEAVAIHGGKNQEDRE